MGSPAQPRSVSTFLWIGDAGRPTYGVVEHFLRWRWPALHPGAEHHHQLRPWRLYTLDRQPTVWPLTDCWPRAGHLQDDFLVWDADVIPDLTDFDYTLVAYRRYDPNLHTGWYIWQRRGA